MASRINASLPAGEKPVVLLSPSLAFLIVICGRDPDRSADAGRACGLSFDLPSSEDASGTHIEGFVVLEIAVTRTSQGRLSNVVGKYSSRASTGEVSSLDVVIYSPKEITR